MRISTTRDGIGGIGGRFGCVFAPRVMRAVYADELKRLGSHAREHRSASADHTLSAALADVLPTGRMVNIYSSSPTAVPCLT